MSGPPTLGRGILDGGDNADVSAAATKIAAHIFADLVRRAGMALMDAGHRRHDLTGRAIAALQRVVVDEGLLHRVRRAVRGREPLAGQPPSEIPPPPPRSAGDSPAP